MNPSIPTGKAVPADWLSNFDRYLISEGTHERAYEKLGAHLVEFAGEQGTVFAVWAPNAIEVRLAVMDRDSDKPKPTTYIQRLMLPNAQAVIKAGDD